MEAATTLSKMKVADLKKELKARGLSVVGNKNELLERLQEAMEAAGDNMGLEGGEPGEGGDEEFDEEEILGEEELDSELTPQEEEAALKGSIRVKDDTTLLEPEKKKISLKRTQPPPIVTEPTPDVETPQEGTAAPQAEAGTEGDKAEGQGEATTTTTSDTTSPPPKKIIKLDGAGESKDLKARAERFGLPLTEEARKEARKARFGLSSSNGTESSKSEEEKKAARAARFGVGGGGGGGKISMVGEKVEIDQLKKRAERFGVVTAPALLKATEEEKRKQRMERFGGAAADSTSADAKKTEGSEGSVDEILVKRKERFGIVDEEEKKRKRAERFAI